MIQAIGAPRVMPDRVVSPYLPAGKTTGDPQDQVALSAPTLSPACEPACASNLKPWQKIAIIGLAGAGLLGGLIAHIHNETPTPPDTSISQPAPVTHEKVTLEDWRQATRPAPGKEPKLRLPDAAGPHADSEAPRSVQQTQDRLSQIQFPGLDPFAASIAADVWAGQQGEIKDKVVYLTLDSFPDQEFRVGMGLQNGPDAPMLVIFPGIHGDTYDNKVNALKRMALESGMNYTTIANPLSGTWQYTNPAHDPGNPEWESQVTYDILAHLKQQFPEYYKKVSVTGYSYGALMGAGVLREQIQHAGQPPIVNGSLALLSPPMELLDSMQQMDHLRDQYEGKHVGFSLFLAWDYKDAIKTYGFDHIMDSDIAHKDDYTTEKYVADTYGSRLGQQDMVDHVDRARGYNFLPYNQCDVNPSCPEDGRDTLIQQQDQELQRYTYQRYVDTYLQRDPWFQQQPATPSSVAANYRYSSLLQEISGHGVPVMTLTSTDDYILNPDNVRDFRQMEAARPADQAIKVYDRGGHTGLLFDPQIRQAMTDFLHSPPH